MNRQIRAAALLLAAGWALPLCAAEIHIGEPVVRNGLEIAAVYLQAVKMEPGHAGMQVESDIHLEADIHAAEDNPHGFRTGDWIPYLGIAFHMQKLNSEWELIGYFMPMVASDGPHYGRNVRLDGPGKYRLSYYILPPAYQGFYRHYDRETGVDEWWEPFNVEWEFTYTGTGKKGGY